MSINRTQWAYRSTGIGKKKHIHTLQSKEGIDRARREWHEEQGTSKIPSEVTLQFQLLSFLLTSCVCVFRLSQWESDSLQPYGLLPARLLCPWDSSGKNTGVGCHALFQEGTAQPKTAHELWGMLTNQAPATHFKVHLLSFKIGLPPVISPNQ